MGGFLSTLKLKNKLRPGEGHATEHLATTNALLPSLKATEAGCQNRSSGTGAEGDPVIRSRLRWWRKQWLRHFRGAAVCRAH